MVAVDLRYYIRFVALFVVTCYSVAPSSTSTQLLS